MLILASCAWYWWHRTLQKRLDEALAQLDRSDPGWRLEDIEDAREQIPDAENSARVVVAAAKLMPRRWPPREFDDIFNDLAQQEQFDPDNYARLEQELANLRPAVEEARKLADMPRGRHRIEYKWLVYETLLTDQSEVRRIAHLLTCDAVRHAQRQDMKAALTSCRASLNAARSLGDEPVALSQLIRCSCVMNTCSDVGRVLAQGEPPSDDLASMQHWLQGEEGFPDMLIAARGERAALDATFDAIENGDVPFSKLEGKRPNVKDYLIGLFGREKFREAHPAMLAAMGRFVAVAQLPMQKQTDAERELDEELRGLKQSNPLAVLFIPALQKINDASRRKHVYLRCTIAALAAERYRQTHKKWPDSLDKLCPQFLTEVPLDPFNGEPLRYRCVEHGIVIYSVSSDGVDNNGNLDREHPNSPGVDIGVRLLNVDKRHQPPPPKPG
jgi:hypothetical protein